MKYPDDYINQIICGDCLEIMKKLPDKSIDLLVTDPPYCIGTTSNGQQGNWQDNNIIKPFFDIYFNEVKRLLKSHGEFYINTDWRTYPFLYPIIVDKLIIKNCIVWDYEWIKAGSHYRFSHEFIIYGLREKDKRKFNANERDVWRIKPMNFTLKNKRHNTEKPEELIEKMILNGSKQGDIVLDTFIGSGTTAAMCHKNNRKYIGIDISEKYCEITRNRIKNIPETLF